MRARVGYSDGPTLSYLTGGAAWVHTRDVNDFTVFGGPRVSRSETNGGFAVGPALKPG